MANKQGVRRKKRNSKRIMLRRVRRKISVAFVIVMAMFLALAIKILFINYGKGEAYSKKVLNNQSYTSTDIAYKRGQILDTNGTVLAYSEKVYNLIFDPKVVLSDEKYKEPTINALTQCFKLKRSALEEILQQKSTSSYEKLLKDLKEEQIIEFKELMADSKNGIYIKGVWFEESYVRKYPFSTLASDVIGFSTAANGGEIGLEKYYDEELSGTSGVTYSYITDGLEVQKVTKDAVDGYNLVTTLDYNIQKIVEDRILEVNEATPSTSTSVIVMNPNNAEVLAMASYPNFDLNNPQGALSQVAGTDTSGMSAEDKSDAMYSLWSNYCVSTVFEPGSTFKTLTIAAALEEGVVSESDTFECHGYEMMAGYKIGCHAIALGGHGTLTLRQALGESCNPALMKIAEKLGIQKMSKYMKMFGMGYKTGIDLPSEELGLVISEAKMTPIDLACNSFGQNININMVQLASAYCAVLNGGYYYKPHLVKRIEKNTGEVVKNIEPELVKQVISAETSAIMRDYLRGVIEDGTAGNVSIEGYDIGGKTGTAQKHPRSDKKWVVSFIGGVPMDDPQVLIYVVVDEPYGTSGTNNHSNDARTIFRNIVSDLIPYMNIYKQTDLGYDDVTEADTEISTEGTVTGTEEESSVIETVTSPAMNMEDEEFVELPDYDDTGYMQEEGSVSSENEDASQAQTGG